MGRPICAARLHAEPLEDRVTPSPAGDLDPTFGDGGRVILAYPPPDYLGVTTGTARAVAVQDDGKIVLGGYLHFTSKYPFNATASEIDRLNPDGSLDTTFGGDGKVTGSFHPQGNTGFEQVVDLAVTRDRRIVAVSRQVSLTTGDFVVFRLNPDGSVDNSFGGTGTVVVPFDVTTPRDPVAAVAVMADGRVVAAGTVQTPAGDDFRVVRLNPDGSADTTFGGSGTVTVPFDLGGSKDDIANGLWVTDDGEVLVAGSADTGAGTDFAVARLRPDGTLDPAFGAGGKATLAFDVGGPTDDGASDVAVLPDGRVVLVGWATAPGIGFAVARLNPDGTPDPTFGSAGRATVSFGTSTGFANSLAVQPDGRVVVGGTGGAFARLNPDGLLDATFGSGGRFIPSFPAGSAIEIERGGLTLDSAGRIVAATGRGVAADYGQGFAAVRLLGDPPAISDLPDRTIAGGGSTGPLAFTVSDAFTPAGELTVTATSDNPALAPADRIVLGGSGADRTVTVTPAAGQTGAATITVTVRDAAGQAAMDAFRLTVLPPPSPPPPALAVPVLAGGPADGSAVRLVPAGGQLVVGDTVTFFADFAGVVRTAAADVTGDGVADYVGGAGPGGGPRVAVIDGATGARLADFFAFEPAFRGGVYVAAADLDGDGRAELVVTPGAGGGPVVAVFDESGGERTRLLGIPDPDFRGGARAALGDVTGDGTPDLVVAAGFLGGPRVAVWDGRSALGGDPSRVADFFAFEDTLRNGAFVAAGDVDGDGFAEVAVGAGPGGAPRVRVVSGSRLGAWFGHLDQAGWAERFGSLFAGDASLRGGVRVLLRDVDGDGRADLVTGSGEGEPSRVRM